ncbi:hypothetical protein PTE30175_00218 [Pandoraea terrae]|uniref:DUF3460 domain-containing protein n=2 Tax=Pandoraea terrae TaxID=1537710 RepID=A0A5E4RN15_9BURK|nr:hypothetical protein PTE30175_00218 [Pandoraea terrae]
MLSSNLSLSWKLHNAEGNVRFQRPRGVFDHIPAAGSAIRGKCRPFAVKSPSFGSVGYPFGCSAHFLSTTIMYESDITQFIKQLKVEKPTLEAEQRQGRALLWDKAPIDLDERARAAQSRVQQQPYVYQGE